MSFGDSFASIMDGTHFSPKSKIGSKKYITSKNIRKGFLDIAECSHISDEEHDEIFKKCPVRFGQVLLTKDGANAGNACLNPLEEEFSLLSSVAVLDGKPTLLTNRYAIQWILSSRGQYGLLSTISGQAITRFTLEAIAGVTIFLPPLAEQKAIASALECWDRAIHKYEEKIEKKKNIKKGLMQRLLSGKQRLPGFEGEWKAVKFGTLFDITSSKRVFQREWKSKGVPFYRAREIVKLCEEGYVDNELFISHSMYEEYRDNYGVPKANDLLVTGVGTVGKAYRIKNNDKLYFKDGNIIWFKHRGVAYSLYIEQAFNTRQIRKQILGQSPITTVATYTIVAAKDTVIQLPPLPEQKAIASVLSSADSEIKALENKLDLVRGQKKYLLNNLVTGTIRPPEFRADGGVG